MFLKRFFNWLIFGGYLGKLTDPLELFSKPQWLKINVDQYIKKFSKIPMNNIDNFHIRSSSGTGRDQQTPGPYRDVNYTMALYQGQKTRRAPRESDYLACIGFDVNNQEISVKQIQGDPGKGEILKMFKWERMLLAILTNWSKENGFSKIRVIQGKNQHWYKCRMENKGLAERMFMHYDVTARRSGFKFDSTCGQYVKALT